MVTKIASLIAGSGIGLSGAHALPTEVCAPPTEPAVWKNQILHLHLQANSLLTFHFNLIHLSVE